MITGLQALVPGSDVIRFAGERAHYHRAKALAYHAQAKALADAGVELTNNSLDPKAGALNKEKEHLCAAEELEFLIRYLKTEETYLLSLGDLNKLGKVVSRW